MFPLFPKKNECIPNFLMLKNLSNNVTLQIFLFYSSKLTKRIIMHMV